MKGAQIDDNNNNSEEDEEEEKEGVGIELTERKADPENDKNVIDFRWSDIQGKDKEDIAKANLIERVYKSKMIKNFFSKE